MSRSVQDRFYEVTYRGVRSTCRLAHTRALCLREAARNAARLNRARWPAVGPHEISPILTCPHKDSNKNRDRQRHAAVLFEHRDSRPRSRKDRGRHQSSMCVKRSDACSEKNIYPPRFGRSLPPHLLSVSIFIHLAAADHAPIARGDRRLAHVRLLPCCPWPRGPTGSLQCWLRDGPLRGACW